MVAAFPWFIKAEMLIFGMARRYHLFSIAPGMPAPGQRSCAWQQRDAGLARFLAPGSKREQSVQSMPLKQEKVQAVQAGFRAAASHS
jgi:hypothetical protein